MCGVSVLQIFEPFSLRCSAYTGKLNTQQADCASWQYYTLSEQKNDILLSLNFCDPPEYARPQDEGHAEAAQYLLRS